MVSCHPSTAHVLGHLHSARLSEGKVTTLETNPKLLVQCGDTYVCVARYTHTVQPWDKDNADNGIPIIRA